MYTASPLLTIDTVNQHGGFVLILVVWALITAVIIFVCAYDNFEKTEALKVCGWLFVVVFLAGVVSFTTGSIQKFENIPVVMNFVEFLPEGYNEEQKSGKYTKRVDVHKLYVVYGYNGGKIVIPATIDQVYPPQAVFYCNK